MNVNDVPTLKSIVTIQENIGIGSDSLWLCLIILECAYSKLEEQKVHRVLVDKNEAISISKKCF